MSNSTKHVKYNVYGAFNTTQECNERKKNNERKIQKI